MICIQNLELTDADITDAACNAQLANINLNSNPLSGKMKSLYVNNIRIISDSLQSMHLLISSSPRPLNDILSSEHRKLKPPLVPPSANSLPHQGVTQL